MSKITIDLKNVPSDIYPEEMFFLALYTNIDISQQTTMFLDTDFIHAGEGMLHNLEECGYIRCMGDGNILLLSKARKLFKDDIDILEELAGELRELWPTGKKDGKWAWRCSKKDGAAKLKTFLNKYGKIEYSDIKSAAERYVKRFNSADGHSGMQLLKYFIMKDGCSALMDEIEGKDEVVDKVRTTTTLI